MVFLRFLGFPFKILLETSNQPNSSLETARPIKHVIQGCRALKLGLLPCSFPGPQTGQRYKLTPWGVAEVLSQLCPLSFAPRVPPVSTHTDGPFGIGVSLTSACVGCMISPSLPPTFSDDTTWRTCVCSSLFALFLDTTEDWDS